MSRGWVAPLGATRIAPRLNAGRRLMHGTHRSHDTPGARARRLAALAALLAAAWLPQQPAHADTVTVSEGNASLKFNTDSSGFNLGQPNDPVQLPRTLEWTVDGRRIL